MPYNFKTIKVKVTKTHISRGHSESPYFCPIALAVNDLIPFPGLEVTVNSNMVTVRLFNANQVYKPVWRAKLPRTATNFVNKIDGTNTKKERLKLKPFNFMLTFNYA